MAVLSLYLKSPYLERWSLYWNKVWGGGGGVGSIYKCHLTNVGNPIVEIRRSYDRLISTMGYPILVRWHLYIESGPWGSVNKCWWMIFPILITMYLSHICCLMVVARCVWRAYWSLSPGGSVVLAWHLKISRHCNKAVSWMPTISGQQTFPIRVIGDDAANVSPMSWPCLRWWHDWRDVSLRQTSMASQRKRNYNLCTTVDVNPGSRSYHLMNKMFLFWFQINGLLMKNG